MSALDDTERVTAMMQEIGEVITKHLGLLPDAVLILRDDGICRTLFAANPLNSFGNHHPRKVLTGVLEQAVVQNRQVNKQLQQGGRH